MRRDSGSALVLMLFLVTLVAALGLLFLRAAHSLQGDVLRAQKRRELEIAASARVAHALNALANNNRLILAALALSEESWLEAGKWGVLIAAATPYWEPSTFRINGRRYGSSQLQKTIENMFQTLGRRSGRGFLIAESLALSSKALVAEIALFAPDLARNLEVTAPTEAFCLAAALVRSRQSDGLLDIPIPFAFALPFPKEENCTARIGPLTAFTFARELGDWKRGSPTFGITLPRNARSVVSALSPRSRADDPDIQSAVTHRFLKVGGMVPLSTETWKRAESGVIDVASLRHAFLVPAWVPYLVRTRHD